MEKLFESWKKRKLTSFGKTCIINTLAVSKFIYKASILPYPNESLIKKVIQIYTTKGTSSQIEVKMTG